MLLSINQVKVLNDVFFLHKESNFSDLSFLIFIKWDVFFNRLWESLIFTLFDKYLFGINNQLFWS